VKMLPGKVQISSDSIYFQIDTLHISNKLCTKMDRNDLELLKSVTLIKSIISIVQRTIQAQFEGDSLFQTFTKRTFPKRVLRKSEDCNERRGKRMVH
jgi:hypothetical protein